MPGVYDSNGLHFQYPENWTLTESQSEDSIEINLESPKGSIWSLNVFNAPDDPQKIADGLLDAMKAEYEDLEFEPATETVMDNEFVGFDLSFFCYDFLVTSKIRCMVRAQQTIAILTEAENREFEELSMVFNAITMSMLMSADLSTD